MVFFLPITFTINTQTMEPKIAPIVSKAATQDASSEVKCTEYSVLLLCISIGKDGDAQPTNWPIDSLPKFASKTIHMFKKLVCQ